MNMEIDPHVEFKDFSSSLITEDVKKIAELELYEKDETLEKCLQTLKEYLETEQCLTPCLDNEFLISFLRARKFDCQAAYRLILKYYNARLEYPSMFRDFNPNSCRSAIDSGIHYFLPYRNKDGCPILLSKFGQWNPSTLTCDELLKFNIMCNEMAICNPLTQICGMITIADMKDFSWSHLLQIPVNEVRCFVNTLQDCLPVRHKSIHIINHSSIFSVLFTLVKPLLSEKIKNRIHFHGYDLSSLQNHIPPEILPEDLGGALPNAPNEDFYAALVSKDEYFIAQQNYGYIQQGEEACE